MEIVDLLIIYLSLGAPLAVHRFQSSDKPSPGALPDALLAGALWVFHLPPLFHAFITSRLHARKNSARVRFIRDLSSDIADSLDELPDPPSLFEIREAVECYVGLSDLLADPETDELPARSAIFAVTDHPDGDMAARVMARRHRKDIRRHRKAYAEQLLGLYRRTDEALLTKACVLRKMFLYGQDQNSLAAIEAMTASGPGRETAGNTTGELRWETQQITAGPSRPERTILGNLTMMPRLRKEDLRD